MFLLSRGHHVMSSTQLCQLEKLPFAKTLTTAAISTSSLHNLVAGQHISLDLPSNVIAEMPPLLKAYMRLGAKICGEPCWDEDFQVADVFILLKRDELCPRYARHFKAAM